jgi:hypothetical protein
MASKKTVKKDIFYIGVIVVLAAVIVIMFMQNTLIASSQQKVLDNVVETYKMLTESDVDVLSTKDEGSLYKLLLRLKVPGGDVLKEVYATKDGRYFSEAGNIIEVSEFVAILEKERNFAECLKVKGLLVLGQKSEPNTLQQLLIIGNYANKLFVECSGANLQACQQIGIQQIPTIIYNNMNYTGVKERAWIEALTGCEY